MISVPSNSGNTKPTTGIFDNLPSGGTSSSSSSSMPSVTNDIHTVKVLEALPTEKYVYLRVDENGDEYWIATLKIPVEVGKTYFYKKGLLKRNFESKEYNRVFDKVYLVSKVVPSDHGASGMMAGNSPMKDAKNNAMKPQKIKPKTIEVEGSVKIADLVDHIDKYKGKEIQISGVCTKLNANIMGRSWIHLKDGSKDDYDLVVTSDVAIPEGHTVTMKGKVSTDLDFGAGYRYDILVENAKVVKK